MRGRKTVKGAKIEHSRTLDGTKPYNAILVMFCLCSVYSSVCSINEPSVFWTRTSGYVLLDMFRPSLETTEAHLCLENHNSSACVPSTVRFSMYHLRFCLRTIFVLSTYHLRFCLHTIFVLSTYHLWFCLRTIFVLSTYHLRFCLG